MSKNKWIVTKQPEDEVQQIIEYTNLAEVAARVLYNRGITQLDDIKPFLKEKYFVPHDPFLIHDMDKGVARLKEAIEKKQRITIYGDYDVDGITSVSLMCIFLKEKGVTASFYIPERTGEGYGLNMSAVDTLCGSTDLLITVDCGITAVSEIEYAASKGMEIIVTDHHQCKDEVPKCCAVINPRYKESKYAYPDLAGVGVAFKLICAYEGYDKYYECLEKYSDIVAIGTIADIMPLTDENRIIVKKGLDKIVNGDTKIGISELINQALPSKNREITASTISYVIAPRINAAGRLGQCNTAVELFLTEDKEKAAQIASELCSKNDLRRETEGEIFNQALDIIKKQCDLQKEKVLILANEGWHQGVIGIVASRLAEIYSCPVFLISTDDNVGKGSGRSIYGFNLFKALESCKEYLLQYGGHELAAGITIENSKIDEFKKAINKYANENYKQDEYTSQLTADCELKNNDINIRLLNQLELMHPHGAGNEQPLFNVKNLSVSEIVSLSDGKHTRLTLEKNGTKFPSVYFGMNFDKIQCSYGDKIEIMCNLNINRYRGMEKIQMIIKDLKLQ